MPRLTRRASVAAALTLSASSGLLASVWLGACGLSQGGLLASASDGGGSDGTVPALDGSRGTGDDSPSATDAGSSGDGETGVQTACTTLDAACLGTLPAGWQPVDVSDAGCGSGFTAVQVLVNPRLADGGCACGACQIVGGFECNAVVAISGGDNCADPTLVTATSGTCVTASAQHVEAHPPPATGTVACTAANDAGIGALTDTLTLCIPGCAVDYCQMPQRCVEAEGDLSCPPGFSLLTKAGTGADPGCAPCGCEAGAPGPCGGTVTAFDNATCTDSGAAVAYPVGTCNQWSTTANYASLLVELVAPDAACTGQTFDDGDASLTGVKTICCK